jgi:hypothetical protein
MTQDEQALEFTDAEEALMMLYNSRLGTPVIYKGNWYWKWLIIRAHEAFQGMSVKVEFQGRQVKLFVVSWKGDFNYKRIRALRMQCKGLPPWERVPERVLSKEEAPF